MRGLRSLAGFFIAFGVAGSVTGTAQLHAHWISCFSDDGQRLIGAKKETTPVLSSADGSLRAYAEIDARVSPTKSCGNTVRLFVAERGSKSHQVYLQEPSVATGNANSLGPVQWSSDSRWLLVERGNWWYESDAGATDFLLYDRKTGHVTAPNFVMAIEKQLRKRCETRVLSVIGFDKGNRVLLGLADNQEEGDDKPSTDCFADSTDWAFDPQNSSVSAVKTLK